MAKPLANEPGEKVETALYCKARPRKIKAVMIARYPVHFGRRSVFVIVIALCLCVMMQMLGAPVKLLSAADISDELAGSVLEGISVPPALPRLAVSSVFTLVAESHPFAGVPAFASALFHPPVG